MNHSLTVIVPVYNGEKYVDDFMKGVVSQSIFNDLSLVFVNDGSKDNSCDRLKEYQKLYPKQITIISKENGGVSSARNAGLDIVETEYFTFADIDDLMHPKLFERLYEMIVQTEADMVCAGIEKISIQQAANMDVSKNQSKCGYTQILDSESAIRILLTTPEQNAVYSKIYRTTRLGRVRFDERLAIAEDKLFVFQCITQSKYITVSDEKLYFYIQQPVSAMSYANARAKLGQDIVLDIIDREMKAKYPNIYAFSVAIKARIHSGSYSKVICNDKDCCERAKYYRNSVKNCPIGYIFKELSPRGIMMVMLVRYLPIVFWLKRLQNRKRLI